MRGNKPGSGIAAQLNMFAKYQVPVRHSDSRGCSLELIKHFFTDYFRLGIIISVHTGGKSLIKRPVWMFLCYLKFIMSSSQCGPSLPRLVLKAERGWWQVPVNQGGLTASPCFLESFMWRKSVLRNETEGH